MVFTDRQLKITPIRSYLSRGIVLEEATGNIAILAVVFLKESWSGSTPGEVRH